MHLTGGSNGVVSKENATAVSILPQDVIANPSRKRKGPWGEVPAGGNKYFGSGRLPAGRGSDEEEASGLETPHCSRTGFDDETGGGSSGAILATGGDAAGDHDAGDGHHEVDDAVHKAGHMLSPMNANILNVEDIDADNLAADFDGSFTGLGVDINTANYSMSETILTLNNIALNSHLKQESHAHRSRLTSLKSDPHYIFSNYGALDLSNDDAQHPDESEVTPALTHPNPPTFSGSVSRDNSQDSVKNKLLDKKKSLTELDKMSKPKTEICSPGHFTISTGLGKSVLVFSKSDVETDQVSSNEHINFAPPKLEHVASVNCSDDEVDARFQYILNAPTSIATKLGEPSLTYINQGQSYELKVKKLGDLSSHYRKKWLRTTIRICFHERRLQYIENEQIAEWARTHPNERILEVDLPLSYGIADIKQDPSNLSMVSFSWDPTRDTGVFIKVHCISTEFTPKKHGGEKGVPFRLQVETMSSEDVRLNAAACIIQVFKLKGADRKHKQDREKVQKRPQSEQEKFSPQYDCTVLTDLTVDNIYIPPSRGISPVQSDGENGGGGSSNSIAGGRVSCIQTHVKAASLPPLATSRDGGTPVQSVSSWTAKSVNSVSGSVGTSHTQDSKLWKGQLSYNSSSEATSAWLLCNRYGQHVKTFANYDARDLHRLSKDDIIQMVGLVDGVRLFNDLHMKALLPRMTIYIAQAGETMYQPILLQEATVSELIQAIGEAFQIPAEIVRKVIVTGPNKILVNMTDDYLRYQDQDSAYHLHLLGEPNSDAITIHLERSHFD